MNTSEDLVSDICVKGKGLVTEATLLSVADAFDEWFPAILYKNRNGELEGDSPYLDNPVQDS